MTQDHDELPSACINYRALIECEEGMYVEILSDEQVSNWDGSNNLEEFDVSLTKENMYEVVDLYDPDGSRLMRVKEEINKLFY